MPTELLELLRRVDTKDPDALAKVTAAMMQLGQLGASPGRTGAAVRGPRPAPAGPAAPARVFRRGPNGQLQRAQ